MKVKEIGQVLQVSFSFQILIKIDEYFACLFNKMHANGCGVKKLQLPERYKKNFEVSTVGKVSSNFCSRLTGMGNYRTNSRFLTLVKSRPRLTAWRFCNARHLA